MRHDKKRASGACWWPRSSGRGTRAAQHFLTQYPGSILHIGNIFSERYLVTMALLGALPRFTVLTPSSKVELAPYITLQRVQLVSGEVRQTSQ